MKNEFNKAWPSVEVIDRYLQGKASPEEVFFVEKTALEHPFFADAVKGYVETGERPNKKDWTPDPTFQERNNQRIYRMLIKGLVVFLFVGSIYLFYTTPSQKSIFLIGQTQTEPAVKQEKSQQPLQITPNDPTTETGLIGRDTTMSFEVQEEFNSDHKPEAFVRNFTAPDPLEPQSSKTIDSTQDVNKTLTLPKLGGNIYHISNYKVVDYRGKRNVSTQQPVVLTGTPANDGFDEIATNNTFPTQEVSIPYTTYLEGAMYLFAKHAYSEALNRYEIILHHFPNDANALFYGGMCNYYGGNYAKALDLLHKSSSNPIQTFHEESAWYGSLSLWELGRQNDACIAMKQIAQSNSFYAQNAADWLTNHPCE